MSSFKCLTIIWLAALMISVFSLPSTCQELPSSFDWRDFDAIRSVKDQGSCNSCWAFCTIACVEALLYIHGGIDTSLCEQELISCIPGASCEDQNQIIDAARFICYNGSVDSTCMLYSDSSPVPCTNYLCEKLGRIMGWDLLDEDIETVKNAILNGPVAAGIDVPSDWETYFASNPAGCYDNAAWDSIGGHGITIIGWDDDVCGGAWICKNSKGPGWGDGGFFKIKYGLCDIEKEVFSFTWEPVTSTNLVFTSWDWDDTGNSNSIAEPGETILLDIDVTNYGTMPATGVTVKIESMSPYITIVDSTASCDDIPADETVTVNTQLSYSIDPLTPNGTKVYLKVRMLSSEDESFENIPQTIGRDIEYVGGNILEDTVWGSSKIYIVTNNIYIYGGRTLTIEPGVIVKFQENVFMQVFTGSTGLGRLVAVGTEADSIVFTSAYDVEYGGQTAGDAPPAPSPGDWEHIVFNTDASSSSLMEYCIVRYGGGDNHGMIYCNHADPSIEHCRIERSSNHGIYCIESSPDIGGNVFTDNVVYPVRMIDDCYPVYTFPNTISGSQRNGIAVSGNLGEPGTWHDPGYPYVLVNNLYLYGGAELTIDPGVVVKFDEDLFMQVFTGSSGTARLVAVGTVADSIVFTSTYDAEYGGQTAGEAPPEPSPGDWQHIVFTTDASSSSLMEYCIVRYGGGDNHGMIYCSGADPSIEHCRIERSSSYGIYCNESSPDIGGNVFTDNTVYPIRMIDDSYPVYTFPNTISGSQRNGIAVSGNLGEPGAWHDPGYPYVLVNNLYLYGGAELTIDPGVVVKFNEDRLMQVFTGSTGIARLVAVGTVADSIVFTSAYDTDFGGQTAGDASPDPSPGDWQHILFTTDASSSSLMEYCVVRYGGGDNHGMIYCSHADPSIEHCRIERSSSHGIYCNESSPDIGGNVFTDNAVYPVRMIDDSYPVYTFPNTISGSQRNGIAVSGNLGEPGDWHDPGYPYVLVAALYLFNSSELTIDPGVIVKFDEDQFIRVSQDATGTARLVAVGTVADSIVFTSAYDTEYGGQTAGDAPPDPSPGDWQHIEFNTDASSSSLMEYCVVRYGGGDNHGMIYCDRSDPSIEHSRIERSSSYGLYGYQGEPLLSNNSFLGDSLWFGVYNANSDVTINAENCWWGSDTGPYDPSPADGRENPLGRGSGVGDYVDYIPWLAGSGVHPVIWAFPHSIEKKVIIGTVQTDYLYLENTGISSLAFDIVETGGFSSNDPESIIRSIKHDRSLLKAAQADIPWISLSENSGELTQGQGMTIEVTFDATGLQDSVYVSYLLLTSNDPDNEIVVIPVTMAVDYIFVMHPVEGYRVQREEDYRIIWNCYREDLSRLSVYFSDDNGKNFTLLANNIDDSSQELGWDVQQDVSDSCLIMIEGEYEGGLFRYGLTDGVFSIVDTIATDTPDDIPVPSDIMLAQNYPNPFNPVTTIEYSLPASMYIRLSIYSVDGRELRVLQDGYTEKGWHREIWDGRNEAGAPVASGVYFLRIASTAGNRLRKLVLLR